MVVDGSGSGWWSKGDGSWWMVVAKEGFYSGYAMNSETGDLMHG